MKRRIIKASENVRGARGGLSHTSPRNFNLQEPSGAEYGKFMTESRWKTWNDAYKLFFNAIENCDNATEECIEEAVRKVYEYHKGNPLMEEAYRRWLDGDEPIEASASVNTQPLQKFVQVNEKFVQLSDDDFYRAIRMHLSDYNQLPEEVHELFGDYGITRGEDDEGYIYIDVEDRIQDATPEAIALLKKHDICADSKKYQVILYTEIW